MDITLRALFRAGVFIAADERAGEPAHQPEKAVVDAVAAGAVFSAFHVLERRGDEDVDRALFDQERGGAKLAFTTDHVSFLEEAPHHGALVKAQKSRGNTGKERQPAQLLGQYGSGRRLLPPP